jgi:hypothetical protein
LTHQIRVKNYIAKKHSESSDLGFFGMEEQIPKKPGYIKPPLPLVEDSPEVKKASKDVIEFQLKQRAGATEATAATYKLKVHRFYEGSAADWIDVRKAILELWTQNSITNPTDKMNNIHSILREDALTEFQAKIEELTHTTDDVGNVAVVPLTDDFIMAGLNAVALTVFLHRALVLQKQWM